MIKAILDPQFQPMAKVVTEFQKNVKAVGGTPLVIAVERNKGYIATYKMDVYKDETGHDEENYDVTERFMKDLLRHISKVEQESLMQTLWHVCMKNHLKYCM